MTAVRAEPSLAVATPETCEREAYGDHRLAAVALMDSLYRAAYPCPVCTGWHLGETGPLVRCHQCGMPVLWRMRNDPVPGVPGMFQRAARPSPTEPQTGKRHGNSTCSRYAGVPERPPIVIVGRTGPGTCAVCGSWHKRIRTADTGMSYCPPCYGHAIDGPRGGKVA